MESLWSWLNTPPAVSDVLDPFGLAFIFAFAVGFLASAYLAGPGGQDLARNDRHAEAIRHWASVGLWIFGPGLFFFAMRALQINPLSFGEPIWLAGCVIALAVAAFRFVEWRRKDDQARTETPSFPLDTEPPGSHPARQQRPPLPSQRARKAGG